MINRIKLLIAGACLMCAASGLAATFKIKVTGEMQPNKQFVQNLRVISKAGPGDTIVVHINSPGGRVDTLLQYQHALSNSGADTVSIVADYHLAASAAGILAITVHEPRLSQKAIFMAHAVHNGVTAERDVTAFLLSEYCSHVLTRQELTYILSGGEVWLSGKTVMSCVNGSREVLLMEQSKIMPYLPSYLTKAYMCIILNVK